MYTDQLFCKLLNSFCLTLELRKNIVSCTTDDDYIVLLEYYIEIGIETKSKINKAFKQRQTKSNQIGDLDCHGYGQIVQSIDPKCYRLNTN